jgi:CheY-like chemotaxis protein
MRVLIFDAAPSIDPSALQSLRARGFDVVVTRTPREAVEQLHQTEFDSILLDVSTSPECLGLFEMRNFMRTSAVTFLTTKPIESLVTETENEGSIEFQSVPALIEKLECFPQPVMLVGKDLPLALLESARMKELRIFSARTLQFATNLMVDGWCQIIWLHAEIPGRAHPDTAAVVHQIGSKLLAILSSALPDAAPGITCSPKPTTAREFVALLRQVRDDRVAPCGYSGIRTSYDPSCTES